MNNLPGLSAEKALYKSNARYVTSGSSYQNDSSIIPALGMSSYRSLGASGLSTYPGSGATVEPFAARSFRIGSVVIGWNVGRLVGGRIGGDLFGDTGQKWGEAIGGALGAVFCFFFDCDPSPNGNE